MEFTFNRRSWLMTPAGDMEFPYHEQEFFYGKEENQMVYMYVGIAGALGAISRYFIGITFMTNSVFPWATLIVNLVGSYLLAWLTTSLFNRISVSPIIATAISTGYVGSFTTFSTLSVETIELFENKHYLLGVLYILVSIIGGLVMSRLGFKGSKEVDSTC